MSARMSVAISLGTLRELLEYQAEQRSEIDPADLADLAIREWLVRQRDPSKRLGPNGYQWKTVFLPEGARLRISSQHCAHFATIVGDELIYEDTSMSPNQFARASLGTVRNAWEAIFVQLPGERDWKRATRLRFAAAAQAQRVANRAHAAALRGPVGEKC